MRKVLAAFMTVMMLISTFAGIMTVSAADVTTTLVEISLGNLDVSAKKGTLTATDYVKSEYTFAAVSNGSWLSNVVNSTSSDAQVIKATYAEPKYTVSTVNTSDLSAYTGIAAGHSAKLLKFTQTANHYLFRLKDFYDVSKLPTTGKLKISVDVYPADIVPGTAESTTASSVKSGTATLTDTYAMRVGDSTGSSDSGTNTKSVVKANQWNTITHEVALVERATMDSVRIDVSTGINNLSSYTNPFPATIFYDKLKIEYIGEAISGGGSTGGDDTTDDDTTGGEVVTVWEDVLNIPFENNSYAPAQAMNIWGKDSANVNINGINKYDTWANVAASGISKPNATEDFGSGLVKIDATDSKNTKGIYEGRLNDFTDFTFVKGEKYKYSIWAYLAKTTDDGATDTASMTIKPYVGSKTSGVGSKNATLTKGQWQKIEYEFEISGEYEAAAGQTSGFRFAFGATSGTNYPVIIYVDNARVEKLTEKVIYGDKTKVNISFEDGSAAPSSGWNFWGKKPGTTDNANALQKVVNWADETSISKPNSTEDFGNKLMKVDGIDTTVTDKGVYTGRVNDIPATVVGFTEGKKYTFSAWILAAKTTTGTAKVAMYPASTDGIPGETFNTGRIELKEGEWKKISASFVATADHVGKTAGFRFQLAELDSTNYATLIYMDNLNIVESDDTSVSYDITVTSDGNGTVTGSGTYKENDTATLTATPDKGYIFVGWYNDTTLLSKENPYEYTVDGSTTAITGKFEKFVPNVGDNWVTIDQVDFEGATSYSGTPTDASSHIAGATAEGLTFTASALDGGIGTKVTGEVLTESAAGIGTSTSNHIYKFTRGTNGTHNAGAMIRFQNFFDMSKLSVGDIIRVTTKVYVTDFYTLDGVDKTDAASLLMFLSVSSKYGSGSREKIADSTGTIYLKDGEWTEIGFTTTVTQDMLDKITNKMGSIRIHSDNSTSYPETIYLDDVKAEVYKDVTAADNLNFVETFDSNNGGGVKINNAANVVNAPYLGKIFSRKDSSSTYTRFNLFGTGCGSDVNIVGNTADLSGVLAHSGHNALKWSGRFSANGGMKVEDIFMGKFDEDDIGRKIRVSAWIYPDKSSGAYKLKWDETAQDYVENSKVDTAEEYTAGEVAAFDKTVVNISFAGPNDAFYAYRTGNYNTKKFEVKWNEWNYIYTDIIITDAILDNGIYDDSVKNPLISAIRIDQQGATGEADQAVVKTFYVDDITVEEINFSVSSAIGTHMVYQKGRPIRVWGTNADIGEVVTVKFNGATKTSTTDENKDWVVEFDKIDNYTRNLTIEISCPGEADIKYEDVSIGEVILASGQSNMEWNLRKVYEAEDIIADAETNENISILSFENNQSSRGSYSVLKSPNGAYWSKKDKAVAEICSGVGYITAYNIAKKYDIPVAVVDANLSGSSIQAWLSAETIATRKDDVYKNIYKEMVDKSTKVSSGSIWKSVPAGMYNSFIAPLDNYEIGIMLWYQGCSNSGNPMLYNYQQYDLINSWREHFGAEDTPFYICQLAPYESSYMELRQVQLDTAKRMDNVHLIVTADLGPTGTEDETSKLWSEMTSGNEIHPVRKIPVAERIALNLYANYFGEDILYSGPEYIKMEVDGDNAILHFKHIGSGIVKSDETKDITGFEISADGTTYVKATAEILADNTIKVYADGITNPVAVRYCWVNWVAPENALKSLGGKTLGNTLGGNLTNDTGIPVGPFKATLAAPTIYAATTDTVSTGIDVSIAVRNLGYCEANPKLIVGLYDGERLVGLKSVDADFKTIDTKTFDFKFYTLTTSITDQTTIKAFLWQDMGSMIPLQGVYPIERD